MQNSCLEESYHVNMIINLLLRFPEIYTVSYNLSASTCSLLFMVKGRVNREQFTIVRRELDENIDGYRYFKKKEHSPLSFSKKYYRGFTQMEIQIKDDYLTEDEIALITALIRDYFGESLVSESRQEGYEPLDNGPGAWEEVFPTFPSRGAENSVQKLIAFREAGKVYIFNQ